MDRSSAPMDGKAAKEAHIRNSIEAGFLCCHEDFYKLVVLAESVKSLRNASEKLRDEHRTKPKEIDPDAIIQHVLLLDRKSKERKECLKGKGLKGTEVVCRGEVPNVDKIIDGITVILRDETNNCVKTIYENYAEGKREDTVQSVHNAFTALNDMGHAKARVDAKLGATAAAQPSEVDDEVEWARIIQITKQSWVQANYSAGGTSYPRASSRTRARLSDAGKLLGNSSPASAQTVKGEVLKPRASSRSRTGYSDAMKLLKNSSPSSTDTVNVAKLKPRASSRPREIPSDVIKVGRSSSPASADTVKLTNRKPTGLHVSRAVAGHMISPSPSGTLVMRQSGKSLPASVKTVKVAKKKNDKISSRKSRSGKHGSVKKNRKVWPVVIEDTDEETCGDAKHDPSGGH